MPGGPIISNVPHFGEALFAACAEPDGEEVRALAALAARHRVHLVIGLGLRDRLRAGVMHNSSLLIGPDGVLGSYTNVHQWQNEKLYFTPGGRIFSQLLKKAHMPHQRVTSDFPTDPHDAESQPAIPPYLDFVSPWPSSSRSTAAHWAPDPELHSSDRLGQAG